MRHHGPRWVDRCHTPVQPALLFATILLLPLASVQPLSSFTSPDSGTLHPDGARDGVAHPGAGAPLATVSYNRNAAVHYAATYWNVVTSDGYFWDSSGSYVQLAQGTSVVNMSGDDCAHYASSVIGNESHAAGGGLNIPSRVPPTYGEPGAGALGDLLINDGWAVTVSSVSQLMPGDLINYEWTSGAGWGHVAVYLGNGTVSAHTNSHYGVNWTLGGAYAYRFVHILAPADTPSISSFTASPSSLPLGGTTYLNVSASGGIPPYSYAYAGLPRGCVSADTSTLTCVPAAAGSFSITVVVTDSSGKSITGTASLIVTSASSPVISSFTASQSTLRLGGTVYFNVSVTGGTSPYSYVYAGLPTGCTSSSTVALPCVPTASGTFSIAVTVTDSASLSVVSGPVTVVVSSPTGLLAVTSFTASPASIPLGGSSYLNVSATGGYTPYSFSYAQLPTGCSSANSSSVSCQPSSTGNYSIVVTVTDATSHRATATTSLRVTPALSTLEVSAFSATPSIVTLGSSFTLSVSVGGGVSPYAYVYGPLPPGCATTNARTLTCTPTAIGSYSPTVSVSDAAGHVATRMTSVVVNAPSSGAPIITSFSISPLSSHVGLETYVNVSVSGGSAPYTFVYTGLPQGCVSADTPSLTCVPSAAGSFTIDIYVNDSVGRSAVPATGTFAVGSASGGTSGGGGPASSSLPMLFGVLAAAGVVLLIGVWGVMATRRRPPASDGPGNHGVTPWNGEP